jgi:hypothetical protein
MISVACVAAYASRPVPSSGTDWTTVVISVLASTTLAAIISAITSVWLASRKSRDDELSRVRDMHAEAYKVVAEYREFPYAIRRRNEDAPGEERVRLSEALRSVQARLSYFEAWTLAENRSVGAAYEKLVKEVRKVAGEACKEAWKATPITQDAEMNIERHLVDLTSLSGLQAAYLSAVQDHLDGYRRRYQRRARTKSG